MIENGLYYSCETTGREKGSFESVFKLGRRNVISRMNVRTYITHGYTLHCTHFVPKILLRRDTNVFRHKMGIFYAGFLHLPADGRMRNIYSRALSPQQTTQVWKENIQCTIQIYINRNALSDRQFQVKKHPVIPFKPEGWECGVENMLDEHNNENLLGNISHANTFDKRNGELETIPQGDIWGDIDDDTQLVSCSGVDEDKY